MKIGKIAKKAAKKVYKKVSCSSFAWKWFYARNSKAYFKQCMQWIDENSTVLDIGCGNGYNSIEFMKRFNLNLVGLDIDNFLTTSIPFRKFDGKNIPFPEKSFDISMFLYVLHHAIDQEQLLLEAKKVTKKYVIVYEDVVNNRFDKVANKLHGKIFNGIYDISNKCTFRSEKEWMDIFERCGFEVLSAAKVSLKVNLMYPVSRMQFVLGHAGSSNVTIDQEVGGSLPNLPLGLGAQTRI